MLNGPLSLTPRFSSFSRRVETAEAVLVCHDRSITPPKRGDYEKELIHGTALEISGPASPLLLARDVPTRGHESN